MSFGKVLFENHSPMRAKNFMKAYSSLMADISFRFNYETDFCLVGTREKILSQKKQFFEKLISDSDAEYKEVFDEEIREEILEGIGNLEKKFEISFKLPPGFKEAYSPNQNN